MRKLKILNTLDAFRGIGGAGNVFRALSTGLAKRGHDVLTLYHRVLELPPDWFEPARERHYRVDESKSQWQVLMELKQHLPKLFRELAEEKFDIIIAHHAMAMLGMNSVKDYAKIPKIYYRHAPWDREYELIAGYDGMKFSLRKLKTWAQSKARRMIEKHCMEQCDAIVVLSKFSEQLLEKYLPEKKPPARIIPGAVDCMQFHPPENRGELRRDLGLEDDCVYFLCTRRLEPRMGIDNLLRAFAQTRKEVPNAKLLITGRGSMEADLKALAKSLGVGYDIRWTGFVEDVSFYYQGCDIFILPTLALEGFGLSTVEALASGIIPLGTDAGATPELLELLDKRLIIRGTRHDAIAERMVWAAKHYETLKPLRKRGREIAFERFTWERHLDSLEAVMESLIKA